MMKCRVCECTDENPCMGGCGWAEPDLCSTCLDTILLLADYYDTAGPATHRGAHGAVVFERLSAETVQLLATEDAEQPHKPLIVIEGA